VWFHPSRNINHQLMYHGKDYDMKQEEGL